MQVANIDAFTQQACIYLCLFACNYGFTYVFNFAYIFSISMYGCLQVCYAAMLVNMYIGIMNVREYECLDKQIIHKSK